MPEYSDRGRPCHDKSRSHDELKQADQYKDRDCAETGLIHREPMERPYDYKDFDHGNS